MKTIVTVCLVVGVFCAVAHFAVGGALLAAAAVPFVTPPRARLGLLARAQGYSVRYAGGGVILKKTQSIALGTDVNIFQGELVERFAANYYGQFGILAAAVGLTMDLTLGDEMVAVGAAVEGVAGYPSFPGDFDFLNVPIRANTLNRCMVHNPTAGAIVVSVVFRGTLDKLATS